MRRRWTGPVDGCPAQQPGADSAAAGKDLEVVACGRRLRYRPSGHAIARGACSMPRGVLGFPAFVLDLAGTFLGLALNYLSLVLSLLAQTHDRLPLLLGTGAAGSALSGPRSRRTWGAAIQRLPCSTQDAAQTLQISPVRYHPPASSRTCRARQLTTAPDAVTAPSANGRAYPYHVTGLDCLVSQDTSAGCASEARAASAAMPGTWVHPAT
jgi:hypothetical protein